jgi:hypothetical protein
MVSSPFKNDVSIAWCRRMFSASALGLLMLYPQGLAQGQQASNTQPRDDRGPQPAVNQFAAQRGNPTPTLARGFNAPASGQHESGGRRAASAGYLDSVVDNHQTHSEAIDDDGAYANAQQRAPENRFRDDPPMGTGVRPVANHEYLDDPFLQAGQDWQAAPGQMLPPERIGQTLASPATRPSDPSPRPTSGSWDEPESSVLNSLLDEATASPQPIALPGEGWGPADGNRMRSSAPPQTIGASSPRPFRNQSTLSTNAGERGNGQDTMLKDCDDFRDELLNTPITSIALDISPPPNIKQSSLNATYRDWIDMSGQVIASGTLVDIRRGYVFIDSNNGRLKIPFARLSEADMTAVAAAWQLPIECFVSHDFFAGRCWQPQTVTWHASNLCHKPLYFENVQLERYGHSAGPVMGPIRATAHFFGSVAFFPYHTAINPPNECQYALGYYRPGNCAPWLVDPFPISLRGAARQGGVMTGGAFLF